MTQLPPGQPPYGAPQYGPGGYLPPEHPQANTVLVLGILSLVVCGVIGPFAWTMGNRVIAEIDASGGQIGGRSNANAGRICGIVATCLIGLSLLFLVVIVILAVLGVLTSS